MADPIREALAQVPDDGAWYQLSVFVSRAPGSVAVVLDQMTLQPVSS